jgi:hypothetical protein
MTVGNPFSNPARSNAPGFRPVSRYGGGAGTLFRGPGGGLTSVPKGSELQGTGGHTSSTMGKQSASGAVGNAGSMGGSGGPVIGGMPSGVREGGSGPRFNPLLNFMDRDRSGIAVGDFRRKLMQQNQQQM